MMTATSVTIAMGRATTTEGSVLSRRGNRHPAILTMQRRGCISAASRTLPAQAKMSARRMTVLSSSEANGAENGSSQSENGSSSYDYDLFVIGGGSGGVRAARFSANMGGKVGLCEMPYNPISSDTEGGLGGTCVLRGCVPKKLMMYASLFHHDLEVAKGFGWEIAEGSKINFADFQRRKRNELKRLNSIYNKLLVNAGVEVYEGRGAFVDNHTVQVGSKTITAKHILIATGGRAFIPDIPGRELVITSDEALELEKLPESMIVVGGGYIGLEKACIFNALGVKVDVFIRGEKILNGFDHEVRCFLQDAIEASGITIHSEIDISAVKQLEDGKLMLNTSEGDYTAEKILFATGRKPNINGLNLDKVGVETKKGGAIVVDNSSRTTTPNIFAVGDVTDRLNLTPVALMEGGAVAFTLFGGVEKTVDHEYVASAVFTQPSLASVGYTEEQAKELFGDIDIYTSNFKAMKQSLLEEEDGITPERIFMKLIVDTKTERVVGAHMIGPDSAEILQGLAIAIKMGAKKSDFDRTIGIHPSAAEEFVTMRTPTRKVRQLEEATAALP